MSKKQIIVVLGSHRSGTSALARGLKAHGVEMGNNFMQSAADNEKGFWEDIEISALNDEVLAAVGCSWHSLRLIEPDELIDPRLDPLRHRADGLIGKKFGDHNRFGFKDPRTCRLLPFWRKVFSDLRLDDRYVIAMRNPKSVASSLAVRNGFGPEQSYLLWLEHIIPAIVGTEGKPRVVIDYDLLMDDPIRQMKRMASVLKIKPDRMSEKELSSYIEDFLAEDLRHTQFDLAAVARDPRLPELALKAYRQLLEFATDKASRQDPLRQKAWQGIEQTFKALAPVYGFLDREIQGRAEAEQIVAERAGQIAVLNQTVASRDAEVASLNQGLAERAGQIDALNQTVASRDAEVASLNQGLAERSGQISVLNQTVAGLDSEVARLNHELAERDRSLAEAHARLTRSHQLLDDVRRQLDESARSLTSRPEPGAAPCPVGQILALHDREFVVNAYRTLLRREPDPGGLEQFLAELRQGKSKFEIIRSIRYSPEGQAAAVEVKPIRIGLAIAWLCQIPLVGRHFRVIANLPGFFIPSPPDPGSTKSLSPKQLLTLHDRDFVVSAYRTLLRREPDSSGLEHCLEALRQGRSKLEIVRQIRYSPEGRIAGVDMRGIRLSLATAWFYGLPLIGRAVRTLTSLFTLPSYEKERRANENRNLRELDQFRLRQKDMQVSLVRIQTTVARFRSDRSKDWPVQSVHPLNRQGQTVAGRNSEIAEPSHELAERDRQIASLNKTVTERDRQINQITIDKDWELGQLRAELKQIYQSRSWRLTSPLRAFTAELRRRGISRTGINRVGWRIATSIYHSVPVKEHTKRRVVDFVFRCFERLFRQGVGYQERKLRQNIVETHVEPIPHPNYPDPSARSPFCFPEISTPVVSVILPAYNKSDYTYACLKSIYEHPPAVEFETIVVDDCSSDDTPDLLAKIGGLRVLHNETNLGFIKTSNRGAKSARGEYLLFLNNDTLVHPGWMDELFAVLSTRPDIGLVGSQLIYADGKLQESGCLTCQDGSSIPLGRSQLPLAPEFNYFREVDFCSGASILVRKADFEAVGGFDVAYSPAYYEDPDLAFKLRAIGKKVFVQPLSKVTHFENVSYGETAYGELTNRNRKVFVDKWASALPGRLYADVDDFRMNRRHTRERVLYIDAVVPVPDRGAGSVDAFYFMRFLIDDGYDVVFYGQHTPDFVPKYTPMIQRIGVECLYRPYIDFERYLSEQGKSFSYVLVSRVYQAKEYDHLIRRYCPNARYIFNTVDVHFLREARQAQVEQTNVSLRKQSERTKELELGIMARADATIVISAEEKTLLEQQYGQDRIHHIPLIREIHGCALPFSKRRDMVFIGSAHLPNVDGTIYFHREIFPLIRRELPDVSLIVIGEELRNALRGEPGFDALAGDPAVKLVGFVEDLAEYFDHVRIMVAPLRYGSGVKGKIATGLAYGLPCVSTRIGIEGMGLMPGTDVLEAEAPEAFAREVVRLYSDQALWERLSENGLAFLDREFALDKGRARLREVFTSASSNRQDRPPLSILRISSFDEFLKYRKAYESEFVERHKIESHLIPRTQSPFSVSGYCALCGQKRSMSVTFDYALKDKNDNLIPNWREHLLCECGLNNRLRASMHLFRELLVPAKTARIYLTEHVTTLAQWMREHYLNISTSEYLGTQVPFGTFNSTGIRNESLTALTFKSGSFDFVLSFDVFEHVPDFLKAFSECARILNAGGTLFFSVPFRPDYYEHQVRAEVTRDGRINHLMEPEYHGNPVDPGGGALCFQVFGWQMLEDLKAAGFSDAEAIVYWSREYGYLGGEQMLFIARKARSS